MALDVQGTDYLKLPVGTTAQRPAAPTTGMTRMNSTTGVPEWYDTVSGTWVQFINSSNIFSYKNRIINGCMRISQRNTTSSVTPINNQYVLDRWSFGVSQASKLTTQQYTGPAFYGCANYKNIASTSAYSIAASDYFYMFQPIEGYNIADFAWGTAAAKTVTLSALVYSSVLTGTFGGSIINPAANRSYPFTYTIPVAGVWTQISITIPGDTVGTWGTGTGIGLYVIFSFGSGSTYSAPAGAWASANYSSAIGANSLVGTSGTYMNISNIQLEISPFATQFEFRSIDRELTLCERYCQWVPFSMGFTAGAAGQAVYTPVSFRTDMRVAATMSSLSADPATAQSQSNVTTNAFNSTYTTTTGTIGYVTSTGSGYSYTFGYRSLATAEL